jgi:hypothetical protein
MLLDGIRVVIVVVNRPVVEERGLAIEDEYLGCALSAVIVLQSFGLRLEGMES